MPSVKILFVGADLAQLFMSPHFAEGGQAREAGLGLDFFQVQNVMSWNKSTLKSIKIWACYD